MSAPITSGKRLLDLNKNSLDIEEEGTLLLEIIKHNRAHARTVKKRIKHSLDGIIVDPTLVEDIDEWEQDDYRYLWAQVIKKYANTVVCINDWNYSNGCAYEFLIAKQLRLRVINEDLQTLPIDKGIILIERAIVEFADHHISTRFLEAVVKELKKIDYIEGPKADYESISNRKH